jgi:hypothetical protein
MILATSEKVGGNLCSTIPFSNCGEAPKFMPVEKSLLEISQLLEKLLIWTGPPGIAPGTLSNATSGRLLAFGHS